MNVLWTLTWLLLGLTTLLPQRTLAAAPPINQLAKSVKEAPTLLDEAAIQQQMIALPPAWTTDGSTLFYEATFEDFVAAIAFVNALVEPAETLEHHPDITVRYNRVSLAITTHDAGGLTDLDFALATRIAGL